MVGAHQNLNGSRDPTTPLSGMICPPRAIINMPTKFEVYLHQLRKWRQNVENGVVWGS